MFSFTFFKGTLMWITKCCIFRPAFECWALQTLVEIVIFSISAKSKKSKKFAANFCKKHIFISLYQNAGRLFYSPKNEFFSLRTRFYLWKWKKATFGNKAVNQHFGANLKKVFFAKICGKFLAFLAFCRKMLKMTISTSVRSAQHPNAGQNIQQLRIPSLPLSFPPLDILKAINVYCHRCYC